AQVVFLTQGARINRCQFKHIAPTIANYLLAFVNTQFRANENKQQTASKTKPPTYSPLTDGGRSRFESGRVIFFGPRRRRRPGAILAGRSAGYHPAEHP